jgi:predicted negative regulator of RcsB-dependent stress response
MQRLLMVSTLALAIAASALFAQKPPAPKSKAELQAVQAMYATQDPDMRIKAAEALLDKYADTEFKSVALFLEAASYQEKNDYDKMIIYAERTLQADPKHYGAMLMLARAISQRTREFDLDKEEKLTRVEKYARTAMELLKDAPKPNAQITDEQWAAGKKEYMAQAHQALGYAAAVRKNYDVAISELKLGIDEAAPDSVAMVRLAQVYNQAGKPDDALALIEKVMAMPDLHPSVRQFAQSERVRATQIKSGGQKPAAPPAPQVEIKKE